MQLDILNNTVGLDDPTPILNKNDWLNSFGVYNNSKWYEPPVNFDSLAKCYRVSSYHSSAITKKLNLIVSHLEISNNFLSLEQLESFVLDYLIFGNAYFTNKKSKGIVLSSPKAKFVKVGMNKDFYFYRNNKYFKFKKVFHLKQQDPNQSIYGLPDYLSCLQSAFLNENATLFRRKYYINGAHAGFVFYVSDPAQSNEDIETLRTQLKSAKGIGNFQNLFFYSPNGKKDGVQIIPLSEVATRDDFFNIKKITMEDILASHRIPPQLLGIIPTNSGGFGNISDANEVFFNDEIKPLIKKILQVNNFYDEKILTAIEYKSLK